MSGDCRDGAVQCEGTGEESEDCNTETCPDWTPWSEWTECSQVRGQSVRWRLMFAVSELWWRSAEERPGVSSRRAGQ